MKEFLRTGTQIDEDQKQKLERTATENLKIDSQLS